MNKTHRIKVLGLLGLPLLAIALAVMVFSWGSSADTTEAATTGANMSMSIPGGDTTTCPETKVDGETCIPLSAKFDVVVTVDAFPTGGYIGIQTQIEHGATGLDCKSVGLLWPAVDPVDGPITALPAQISATDCQRSAVQGPLTAPNLSLHKGDIWSFSYNCTDTASQHVLVLVPFFDPGFTGASGFSDGTIVTPIETAVDLLVNCVPGPTATPTSTPPPIPKMSKLPALQNVFLTRQSSKIPPTDCLAAPGVIGFDNNNDPIFGTTNIGGLSETLSQAIVSADPKATGFQQLGAFEFEVHYDATKVCVDLTVGDSFAAAGAICIVEDSASKPQLEGVARIGCFTIGKSDDPEAEYYHEAIDDQVALAQVDVYPQPEIYSQAKPNQDNGVVVQINNVNCDLGDEQGHAIPIFSCDDADITFRYLEGDVEPDCAIDTIDAQVIAFRWGAEKGSLIYKDFMNLEPSSQQADNDIDINDLQFVFGRFGSSCEAPHPPQPPVNPKA